MQFLILFVLFVPVCPYMYETHAWGQIIVVSKCLQNSNVPVNNGYNGGGFEALDSCYVKRVLVDFGWLP